jgi:Asp/Glu/hydantoin racemase
VKGGQNIYGFSVGVLMLDTRFPRIPGEMGNATTFPFPVRRGPRRGWGAGPAAEGLLDNFIEGARYLEREGVGAVTTNCGFLVKFQPAMAAAVKIPVFTSSLLLVPLVYRQLAPGRRVGIMTVNAPSITPEHMKGAGITSDIPLAITGLETEKHFTHVMLDDEMELDVDLAREEHVRVARRLVDEHPDIGSIVLECTNMPPYADDIRRVTGLPVFDITSLVRMAHDAIAGSVGPRPA